jgi:hypothetical protein
VAGIVAPIVSRRRFRPGSRAAHDPDRFTAVSPKPRRPLTRGAYGSAVDSGARMSPAPAQSIKAFNRWQSAEWKRTTLSLR